MERREEGQRTARAFVGLGANLGDRAAQLRAAVQALDAADGVTVAAASPVYESAAHTLDPEERQPAFLNAVVEVQTTRTAAALLGLLHQIERDAGRERRIRWAARPLDLDLLVYDRLLRRSDEGLAVPHPRLAERRFVLQPLADLAPDFVVPGTGRTVADLLAACPDPNPVRPTPHALLSMPSAAPTLALRIPDTLRYVAVEGVIGAGKTSLARLLAERMGGRLVLEQFDENPFLPDFYRDPERWAFQTQLAFLASRFRQQKALAERDLFQQATVADYTFDKDRIFAHVTLSGDELGLYENLYGLMEPATVVPDLVVYLRSSVDRLVRNVKQRGRAYEQQMERNYLAELSEAYDRYFFHYQKGPLLIVDSTRIDFVHNEEHARALLRRIAAMAGARGTVFFNPPAQTELDLR
ncbi:MAG: 2-amino-4-hydroxy-6-hydroxymethyldihydropteridine diphosphokinase [Rhodothermales bacterium]|nr:2-amino-4-hydroxy-6-hydroxymethyldihydropteridine diphosphokinase [Rhodothermales bacterium]